jgi:prepilin-type N-terminal cleavage/methylation domain-containing protein
MKTFRLSTARAVAARPGFTIAEVLIALTITGIIGAAVTSVFITQTRFYDRQEKTDFARGVSRSAMNILTSELRMIERDSGVVAADSTSITLRVPYVLGISCGGSGTTMSLRYLPTDTVVLRQDTVYSGYARMTDTGRYRYHDISSSSTITPNLGAGASVCITATDTVRAVTDGGTMQLTVPTNGDIAPIGFPVMLYRKVKYEFKASVAVPGSVGLWRTVERNGSSEELLAPFSGASRFRFFVNDGVAAVAAAPASLRTLTGIEVTMEGISERPDANGTYPKIPVTTSIFFKNRVD